ncbi:hypothetical protein B0H17DRAFT_1077356, partial [Mycena rosella]
ARVGSGLGLGPGLTVLFCSLHSNGFSTPLFNHQSIKMIPRPTIATCQATIKVRRLAGDAVFQFINVELPQCYHFI